MSLTQENKNREFQFSDADFNFIRELVFKKTGINIADHKRNMIYSRIAKRLRSLQMGTFTEYCKYLESSDGGKEITDFINAVTTNLTKFFREIHHFEHLEQEALPEMINKNRDSRRLRIWSAGCSSGMEPYTISMVLNHNLTNIKSWDAKILATDIDTNMLARGEQGEYKISDVDSVPAKYRKYININKKEELAQMKDELKAPISFKQLNFMDDWPIKGPFDIIFCRNVVIYFKKETQRVLFDKFANVLADDGLIYIGHSENLAVVSDRFEHLGRTIYRKIK